MTRAVALTWRRTGATVQLSCWRLDRAASVDELSATVQRAERQAWTGDGDTVVTSAEGAWRERMARRYGRDAAVPLPFLCLPHAARYHRSVPLLRALHRPCSRLCADSVRFRAALPSPLPLITTTFTGLRSCSCRYLLFLPPQRCYHPVSSLRCTLQTVYVNGRALYCVGG